MNMKTSEDTIHTTDLGTLWSETLFEMLNDAVQNDWSLNAVTEILKELHSKGYRIERVVRKIKKKYGDEAASRLLAKIKS